MPEPDGNNDALPLSERDLFFAALEIEEVTTRTPAEKHILAGNIMSPISADDVCRAIVEFVQNEQNNPDNNLQSNLRPR